LGTGISSQSSCSPCFFMCHTNVHEARDT
jgi:hypothetical protein